MIFRCWYWTALVDRLELLIVRLQAERRAARTEAQLRREVRRG